jgi:hypothetical protein
VSSIRWRLKRLEGIRTEPEDERERAKQKQEIWVAAEQENERYFRELAIERRTAFLGIVGYGGHSAQDLRDEHFLDADGEPPFTITEAGEVFCARDGKPVTTHRQTLAEAWYWQEVEWGGARLVHDEEAEVFYTSEGELALSRHVVNLQYYLDR